MLGRNTRGWRASLLSWRQGHREKAHEGHSGTSHLPPLTPEPKPGALQTLPVCTSAPKSLSHSELLVPNRKLLLPAKKEKTEGTGRETGWGRGKEKISPEGISAAQNNSEDQSWEMGQTKLFTQRFFLFFSFFL